VFFGMIKMRQLFILNCENEVMELRIARPKKEQLILQMPVNSGFHRSRTDPNTLTTQQGRSEAQHQSTIPPERHYTTWPGFPLGHGISEHCTMINLMTKRFLEKCNNVRTTPPCHPNLRPVDANGTVLAGVVDL